VSAQVEVEVITEVNGELVAAFARLVPQLSRSAPPPDRDTLAAMIRHDAITLLVARLDGEVVGTLTLVMFPIPTGLRAWIEDVVVDESARRTGTGQALSEAAVRIAQEAGARTVDLTSRPSRQAAGRLYERIGFVQRDSRVYRYAVETGAQDS
jgi:ribosomal protein S18 acetylase RimI-like enzyme